MDIRGRGVLVTGGTKGLGRALAERLARAGARVVLLARDEAAVAQTVAEIRRTGDAVHGLAADMGEKSAVHAIAQTATAVAGPIDLVIHNASTLGAVPMPLLLDTECEDLERVLAVNLLGPFRLTKILAGSMALRGGGLIVHVSSDAAVEAYPGWGAYGVSKAALDHLGRIWAAELDGTGVLFLTVDPGEMDTAMHAAAVPGADPASLERPEAVASRLMAIIAGAESLPPGARVEASEWDGAAWAGASPGVEVAS